MNVSTIDRGKGSRAGRVAVVLLGMFATAAICVATRTARADEVLRIAMLVGSNRGAAGRTPLHYAEQDAAALGQVLIQLGGFRPENVHLVLGGNIGMVGAQIARIKADVAAKHARGQRAVVLFYFSGHSDGQSFELGTQRLPFADVRRDLLGLGADVRIVIVDSCRSGALLAEKGGTPGPTFDIRFTDDLATSGEAVLTSSAADEMALESREIRASFFSHHFVSGLRGAADSSGDGRVTLGEAYRYAFVNTLLATSNTLNGPQHPGYDYRLTGQGELVLTDLQLRGAKVSLPKMFDRVLIADEQRRHLVAELTDTSALLVALPAGRYVIQGRRGGRAHEASVDLREGQTRELAFGEFTPIDRFQALSKGDGGDAGDGLGIAAAVTAGEAPPRELRLGLSLGLTRGAARAVSRAGVLSLNAGLGSDRGGWEVRLDLVTGSATGFRESAAYLSAGPFVERRRGRAAIQLGWRLLAGPLLQSIDGGSHFWTLAVGTGPWVGAGIAIGHQVGLTLGAGADGVLLRRDGRLDGTVWPMVGLGVEGRW